ncbi:MAG: chemotaxis protein CheW [Dehalococcoidia bacterium]
MANWDVSASEEELQVFLQDADEQLQVLDEDIVKLENEGYNDDLLNEIFRAAHTLKGSSAMVGCQKMADLAHAMESTLDKLRNQSLDLTPEVTDMLLSGLDGLGRLRNNLTSPGHDEYDVDPVIAALNELAKGESSSAPSSESGTSTKLSISIDDIEKSRLEEAISLGHGAYQIGVEVNRESSWAAVRCFQVLSELGEKGQVIASKPTYEDIEAERVDYHLEIVFAGPTEASELEEMIYAVPDIAEVQIIPYSAPDASDDTEMNAEISTSGSGAAKDEGTSRSSEQSATSEPSSASGGTAREAVKTSETVRVDVERLDSLMNMIGELVVARTRMNQIGKTLEHRYKNDQDVIDLGQTFTHLTKIVDTLQTDISAARMLPVGSVFGRFPRMMRDLAHKAGKKIDFVVTGQETEIDRSVIEHIRDPLTHLLRNAVDHGIEMPEERGKGGKPEKATVRLSATNEQSHIVISVEDDGRGVDSGKVKEKAVQKGIISAEAAGKMTENELLDLIFEPGMSTAEKATEVSGRGVGMDVVKKNIERLNGAIGMETNLGSGTRFTMKLPLTLATFQGLLVSSGGMTYVFPLVSIDEVLRLEREEIGTVLQNAVIIHRNTVIPIVDLENLLDAHTNEDGDTEVVHIVVAKSGERKVGVIVDSVREPQEVVVKSMGDYLSDIQVVSGASILGNGEVALILDIPSLIRLAVMADPGKIA